MSTNRVVRPSSAKVVPMTTSATNVSDALQQYRCGAMPFIGTENDFYDEDRHELVQKVAYQHWEKRGSPLGSPEIDWLAAEKTVRAYLLGSGIELGPDEDLYS